MTATSNQSDETTLKRLKKGTSLLGFLDSHLVGTISVVKKDRSEPIDWFQRDEVFFFTQFAVRTDIQGKGIGMKLLSAAEEFAKSKGAKELALDTSEKAEELVAWYKRRGYRFVEFCQLPSVTYRSIVLSKNLGDNPYTEE